MDEPTLRTPRLHLRLLDARAADRDLYRSLYTSDDVMQWVGPVLPPEQADAAFAHVCRHNMLALPGHRFWLVQARADAAAGIATLRRRAGEGELGAMLLPAWRSQGIAREAFGAIARHAFDSLGMEALNVQRPDDPQALIVHRMLTPLGFRTCDAVDGQIHWRLEAGELAG